MRAVLVNPTHSGITDGYAAVCMVNIVYNWCTLCCQYSSLLPFDKLLVVGRLWLRLPVLTFRKMLGTFVKRERGICIFYDFTTIFAETPLFYNSRSCIMASSADNC